MSFNAQDLNRVDISPKDIKDALNRPSDFGYHGDKEEMFSKWSWGPCVLHRDSGLVDTSNYHMLVKALEEDTKAGIIPKDSYDIARASNWAVGWSEHLNFHAIDDNGEPTQTFRWIKCWFDMLQEYPLASESDHSERELEATLDNIRFEYKAPDTFPTDWAYKVWGWLWDNNQESVYGSDDGGGCPSEENIVEALVALKLLTAEEDE